AMICCFFSSFKTFAMLREATYPPAAVNVLDVSSESMAAFQVFMYGRFWVFTEVNSGERKMLGAPLQWVRRVRVLSVMGTQHCRRKENTYTIPSFPRNRVSPYRSPQGEVKP